MPVASDVLTRADTDPGQPAISTPAGTLTYAAVGTSIRRVAAALAERDVHPGDLVAVDPAEPGELLIALLGADAAGAVPLVCDPSWTAEQVHTVVDAVRPVLRVSRLAPLLDRPASRMPLPKPGPGDAAWAGFSSGSTGRPRAVVRTRASWTASYPALDRLAGSPHRQRVLVPGPLSSSLFCFAALYALASGAHLDVPGRWIPRRACTGLSRADVVHAVPHMLEQMVTDLEAGDITPRARTALVGGAALPAQLRERATAVGMRVIAYYGAVELSFVAVDPDGSGLRPFDEVEIDVRPLRPGADLGEVWVRSPWLATGYLGGVTGPLRRDDAGWATVGDLADAAGPWLSTRDGLPRSGWGHGRLTLRGRGDGAVLTAGATVIPDDVEAVLKAVPGVGDVVVVGTPHDHLGAVVTAVVETCGRDVDRAELDRVAQRDLSPAQRPRRWWQIDQLPRTPTGKPARAVVSEQLLSGTLGVRPFTRHPRRVSP